MNAPVNGVVLESEARELTTSPSSIELISAAEINQQIATAKKYPRQITTFMREARQLVTLNESIAQQCIYALPRDGKVIEGPSARFAEIMAHAWGNSRAGARVVHEGAEFLTAQGVMHDLERNVAITFEVQRRITGKGGKRYGADMIGVTANAACSIALRNAILKVVPKAFWQPLYDEARKVVAGDVKTLSNKRAEAIAQFQFFGVSKEQLCAKLGRAGIADITVEDLVTLFGILTAIKEGDTTPEQAFAEDGAAAPAATPPARAQSTVEQQAGLPPYPADRWDKALGNWRAQIAAGTAPDQLIAMLSTKYALTAEQKAAIRALSQPAAEAAAA